MAEPLNLTGHWSGHYYQHGTAHPIAADLVQTGARVSGTMTDSNTQREQSVFETAVEAGLPPGADEQITLKLRQMFPDAGGTPIRHVMQLPPQSILEGAVSDRGVYLRKTYPGEHFSGFRVGEHLVGERIAAHVVHYRGRISDDGKTIEGRWSIVHQ